MSFAATFRQTWPSFSQHESVVAQWCNPLTLQPEQSGGVGSIPGRTLLFGRHDKGSWTRLGLRNFYDPNALRCKSQLHLHLRNMLGKLSLFSEKFVPKIIAVAGAVMRILFFMLPYVAAGLLTTY